MHSSTMLQPSAGMFGFETVQNNQDHAGTHKLQQEHQRTPTHTLAQSTQSRQITTLVPASFLVPELIATGTV